MAAKTFSVMVVGNNDQQPVISGNKVRTFGQLVKYFRSMAGGARRAATTMRCKNDLVSATGTVTCATVVAGNTVTINGVTCTAAQLHATGTVTMTVANTDVDDTVTINGVAFTAKASETLGSGYFNIGSTDAAAATSLAACINASTNALISGVVTATAASNVVTVRYYAQGTGGNAITFVSSDADGLAVSGSGTLTNGAAKSGNQFCFTGSNSEVATELASCINASTTALILNQVTAAAASAVVTLTAYNPGLPGNAVTLASSGATLTVSGARLTGGSETVISFTF